MKWFVCLSLFLVFASSHAEPATISQYIVSGRTDKLPQPAPESESDAAFRSWVLEIVRGEMATSSNAMLVRIDESHTKIVPFAHNHHLYEGFMDSKGTIVRSYKGSWKTGDQITVREERHEGVTTNWSPQSGVGQLYFIVTDQPKSDPIEILVGDKWDYWPEMESVLATNNSSEKTAGSTNTLTTPSYKIEIIGCPEYVVSCDDVVCFGVELKTGRSFSLKGRTVHTTGKDGVTPSHFLGYEFIKENMKYFVGEDGKLQITEDSKVLVDENGAWDY